MVDLRIKNGKVITMDAARPILNADIYVNDGLIAAVGGPKQEASRTIDASGMVVMPGMNDCHNHLRHMTPGLPLFEGIRRDDILHLYWRMSEAAGIAEYRIMAAFSTAQLLKAGVTATVDHIYPLHHPGLVEASVEGYSLTGIRWFMARGMMTRGYDPIVEPAEEAFAAIREIAGDLVPNERLFISPVSIRHVEADAYVEARRLADELGLGLCTKVAETEQEVNLTLREHNARPVELLHKLGFAGENAIFANCIHLSEEEIEMLAESGTHVVHSPVQQMKQARGFTPVLKLLEAGVNVALGANQLGDVLREARQELLSQGACAADPFAFSPGLALQMATTHGAKALGMDAELGTVEVGKRADLICVDLSGIHNQPNLEPLWTLIHRATNSDVMHVMVDGELVVHNRKLTRIDEEALVKETRGIIRSYLNRVELSEFAVWS